LLRTALIKFLSGCMLNSVALISLKAAVAPGLFSSNRKFQHDVPRCGLGRYIL
jgi:hypothetical protein